MLGASFLISTPGMVMDLSFCDSRRWARSTGVAGPEPENRRMARHADSEGFMRIMERFIWSIDSGAIYRTSGLVGRFIMNVRPGAGKGALLGSMPRRRMVEWLFNPKSRLFSSRPAPVRRS